MIAIASLRWVLTGVFLLTSGYHLVRVLRPLHFPEPVGEHWVSEVLHLIMNGAMVAMLWPAGRAVPLPLWVVVFTASTGWFVVRTLRSSRRWAPAFFASTMAVMVWMGTSVPVQAAGRMPGMRPAPGADALLSGVLGGYLVLAAFWWFFRGLRLGRLPAAGPARPVSWSARPLNWSALCHGLMAIGMGLVLLAMV